MRLKSAKIKIAKREWLKLGLDQGWIDKIASELVKENVITTDDIIYLLAQQNEEMPLAEESVFNDPKQDIPEKKKSLLKIWIQKLRISLRKARRELGNMAKQVQNPEIMQSAISVLYEMLEETKNFTGEWDDAALMAIKAVITLFNNNREILTRAASQIPKKMLGILGNNLQNVINLIYAVARIWAK